MKTQELGNFEMFGNQSLVKDERHSGTSVINVGLGLLLALFVVCGILTLAVASTLGWLYGVRQNGVVSGFPQRSGSM